MKPRKMALVALLLLVSMAAVSVGGWFLYEYSEVAHWQGGYQLQIHVAAPRTIREVRCYTAFNPQHADIAAHDPNSWNELREPIKPYVKSPIEARVRTGGRSTRSGRDISHFQDRWLAVVAEFDDGTRVGKVVEIPDMQVGREVRVEFP